MAIDFPYIIVNSRDNSDGHTTVFIKTTDDSFNVSQQALADAVKAVLTDTPGVTGVDATKYEMSVTSTIL